MHARLPDGNPEECIHLLEIFWDSCLKNFKYLISLSEILSLEFLFIFCSGKYPHTIGICLKCHSPEGILNSRLGNISNIILSRFTLVSFWNFLYQIKNLENSGDKVGILMHAEFLWLKFEHDISVGGLLRSVWDILAPSISFRVWLRKQNPWIDLLCQFIALFFFHVICLFICSQNYVGIRLVLILHIWGRDTASDRIPKNIAHL